MKRSFASLLLFVAVGASCVAVSAADKLSGRPLPAETKFVEDVSADLNARFPTLDAARRAGFVRYTDEDDTGAISYANRRWVSKDAKSPSQLWYDVNGRLIGADFSVLQSSSATPPSLWGVDPSRWVKIGDHVHFGLVGPNGTTVFGGAALRRFAAQGVTATSRVTPDDLVAAGLAKRAEDVRFVFQFPAIWDLQMWTTPNRNGAFAEKNPDVKPVGKAGMDMGH
ncbi:MAG: hypothetical protein GIW95_06880 [Candidatus Eremiobacteraeota bacterium]|nr:hypothetical protein [Candidatus Eremiobacteraeota bacterium]